jgi:hypothetical protein
VNFAASYGQTYLFQWVGQRVLFDLRSALFAKFMRLHPGFYDKNPVGRLMTRITSDVDAINQFITGGLVGVIADLFTLFGLLAFMLTLSPRLTQRRTWKRSGRGLGSLGTKAPSMAHLKKRGVAAAVRVVRRRKRRARPTWKR